MGQFPWKKAPSLFLGITLCFQIAADSSWDEDLAPSPEPDIRLTLSFPDPAVTNIAISPEDSAHPHAPVTENPIMEETAAPLSLAPAEKDSKDSFEWPTVWLSAPDATSTDPWLNRTRFKILEKRLDAFSQKTGDKTPHRICLPLREAADITYDPERMTMFLDLSKEQSFFLSLLAGIERTGTGGPLVDALIPYDLILCNDDTQETTVGVYDIETGIVSLKFRDLSQGTSSIPEDPGIPTGGTKGYGQMLYAIAEELSHAWQDNTRDSLGMTALNENIWAADALLWLLAVEAQAKVIASITMVEHILDGDQRDFSDAMKNGGMDSALLHKVMTLYIEHGKKAIEKNPSLLRPAFLSFFENLDFMDAYFLLNAETINENFFNGRERVSPKLFVQTFGTIPGKTGNMLAGWENKKNLDVLIAHIAKESSAQEWFLAQSAARRKGLLGPQVPVPDQNQNDTAPSEDGGYDTRSSTPQAFTPSLPN